MKEQRYYQHFKNHIILMIALSLVPGLVYVIFGWFHDIIIPALIWYALMLMVSFWGWKLYVRYQERIMEPSELASWYEQLKVFYYCIFSLWTLIFLLYAGESGE